MTSECKAILQVERVRVSYRPEGVESLILDNFSSIFDGGMVYVLMGPNGCGKSTLLKLIVGEMRGSAGMVKFSSGGKEVSPCIDYIPQNYRDALFPWKRVATNVWPWRPRRKKGQINESQIKQRVQVALEKLGLSDLSRRYPYELSGGQQQAILLARSIAAHSTLIVMDEPFSALDVVRRTRVAGLLRAEWRSNSRVVICAMHEPDEAAVIADKVIFLNGPAMKIVGSVARDTCMDGEEFRRIIFETVNDLAKKGG
jgi:NitT/TauT family transport system ATP-binding protein